MIQRIQTVYLLLSVAAVAAMQALPLAQISGYSEEIILNAISIVKNQRDGFSHVGSSIPVSVLIIINVALGIFTVFSYKKRSRQMMLAKLTLLLLAVLIATVFFYADYAKSLAELPDETIINYKIASILPVISIVLTYLAIRAIKKDEELVRAADRLR